MASVDFETESQMDHHPEHRYLAEAALGALILVAILVIHVAQSVGA
jgi:hypothetical protein